jgi:hypothetical protein
MLPLMNKGMKVRAILLKAIWHMVKKLLWRYSANHHFDFDMYMVTKIA